MHVYACGGGCVCACVSLWDKMWGTWLMQVATSLCHVHFCIWWYVHHSWYSRKKRNLIEIGWERGMGPWSGICVRHDGCFQCVETIAALIKTSFTVLHFECLFPSNWYWIGRLWRLEKLGSCRRKSDATGWPLKVHCLALCIFAHWHRNSLYHRFPPPRTELLHRAFPTMTDWNREPEEVSTLSCCFYQVLWSLQH